MQIEFPQEIITGRDHESYSKWNYCWCQGKISSVAPFAGRERRIHPIRAYQLRCASLFDLISACLVSQLYTCHGRLPLATRTDTAATQPPMRISVERVSSSLALHPFIPAVSITRSVLIVAHKIRWCLNQQRREVHAYLTAHCSSSVARQRPGMHCA